MKNRDAGPRMVRETPAMLDCMLFLGKSKLYLLGSNNRFRKLSNLCNLSRHVHIIPRCRKTEKNRQDRWHSNQHL